MEMNSVATAATSTNIFAQECEQKRRNKQTNFVFYVHEVRQTRENRKYKAKWCNGVDATIERCERKIIVEVKMNVKFDRIKNKDTEKKKKAIQKNRRLPQTNRWISFIQNGRLRPYSGRLDANNLQFRRICVFSYCFRNQYSNALFFQSVNRPCITLQRIEFIDFFIVVSQMMSCTHNHKRKMNDDEQKYSDKSIVRNCKRRTLVVCFFFGLGLAQ